jgi:hypothetical protein
MPIARSLGLHPEVREADLVDAVRAMQQKVSGAPQWKTGDGGELARCFNALLQQAKDVFPGLDMLRLIEPLGPDASTPLIAVRLVMIQRTIDAQLAAGASYDRTSSLAAP